MSRACFFQPSSEFAVVPVQKGMEVRFDGCAEFRHPFLMQVGLSEYRGAMLGQLSQRDHYSGEVVRHSLLEEVNPRVGHDADTSSCQQ